MNITDCHNFHDFRLLDYLHFSLWAGGLYFALRGNFTAALKAKSL